MEAGLHTSKFLSTLSLRRATAPNHNPCSRSRNFYPRSPCGERPIRKCQIIPIIQISIHALLAESDTGILTHHARKIIFLSTLSLRRATFCLGTRVSGIVYFYPRSPCGERQCICCYKHCKQCISIHALLAESDSNQIEADRRNLAFLSTLSLRRATAGHPADGGRCVHFYPRSPCGERPATILGAITLLSISIHALLAESDKQAREDADTQLQFLSTLSLRRATSRPVRMQTRSCNFYPRSPCGERRSPLE